MAAVSRMGGGDPVRIDPDEGLIPGRAVARYSGPKDQDCFDGTAPRPMT